MEEKPFSSFAYLIDATEIFVAALSASAQYQDIPQVEIICGDLEARIISWFLLLPLNKRELPVAPGLMDQLMFQAHMMMYTYVIIYSIGTSRFLLTVEDLLHLFTDRCQI
jgi:hypothetical protein